MTLFCKCNQRMLQCKLCKNKEADLMKYQIVTAFTIWNRFSLDVKLKLLNTVRIRCHFSFLYWWLKYIYRMYNVCIPDLLFRQAHAQNTLHNLANYSCTIWWYAHVTTHHMITTWRLNRAYVTDTEQLNSPHLFMGTIYAWTRKPAQKYVIH